MSIVEMLARAREVKHVINTEGVETYSVGLCALLIRSRDELRIIHDIFLKWPENTHASIGFPVPAPDGYEPRSLYGSHKPHIDAYDNLPKYTGEYGAARLRLLDFIIAELEKLT